MGEPLDPNQQGYEPWPVYGPPPGPSLYAQPPYAQPPYAQPPYGQAHYPSSDPFGVPQAHAPMPSPPPAPNRTRLWLVGSGAVTMFAALALVLTFVVFDDGSGSGTAAGKIKLPTDFDGYSRVESDTARQVEKDLRTAGAANAQATQFFDAASIGVYAHNTGDRPTLVAVVVPTSSYPNQTGRTSDEIAADLLRGAVLPADVQTVSNGAHDGSAECGSSSAAAAEETLCSWSDEKTTGLVVSVAPALTILALSAVQSDLRDAVD